MAFINRADKKVTARIIYYGPEQAGKNTSLLYIYDHVPEKNRGKLVSLATEQGSKISFEYHPDHFSSSNYDFVIQLSTVSGQVTNNLLRHALVNGADGCVFLADMQPSCQFANFKCYQNLEEDLRACGRTLKEFPMIIQYNKMDLPNILPVGKMNLFLNSYNVQFFETCATSGSGVLETLDCITALVWNDLNNKGILIGAARSISKNAALSMNEPGISVIGSSDENSALTLLQQANETQVEETEESKGHEFEELEIEYGSSDPDEIEIDYGNSPIAAFPFEQKFEFEELLQLADKIAPKAEPESEHETTQELEAQPGEAVQSAVMIEPSPEPVFTDLDEEEVFADVEEQVIPHEIEESETIVFADAEPDREPATPAVPDLETSAEPMPTFPEIQEEPATSSVPDPVTVQPVTQSLLDVTSPQTQPVTQSLLDVTSPQIQPVTDLPPATSAIFAGDIRVQVLFSYLETAISNKDFNSVKNISEQVYSYLLERLAQKRGVATMNADDASKWLSDLGIPISQQSLYQKAILDSFRKSECCTIRSFLDPLFSSDIPYEASKFS